MTLSGNKKYEAEYTLKNGEKTTLKVKFNPERLKKLIATGLVVFTVVSSLTGCVIKKDDIAKESMSDSIDDFDIDIVTINQILKSNPNLLVTRTPKTQILNFGDTISGIAAKAGCTINEICEINNIKDASRVQLGQAIKYYEYEEKSELDQEIIMYETYLHDYFSASEFVQKFYKGEYHKDAEYRLKEFISDMNTGIMALVGKAEYRFYGEEHPDLSKKDIEQKEAYLNELVSIYGIIEEYNQLNNNRVFIPYETFRVYCKNGHTNSLEIEERFINIYN